MDDFNLDISDRSIEALGLRKKLFGKFGISSYGRVELKEGIVKNGEVLDLQKLAEKIRELVKRGRINFTLPDLRTFTCRIVSPLDVAHSAMEPFLKEKAAEVIPYDLDDLVYDFKVVNETEEGKEILFIAVAKKILVSYLKTFEILKLTPLFAVPESIAAFEIFKNTVVKDEVVLYVDIGSKISTFSFFDKFGPLLTLNEPVEVKVLKKEAIQAVNFIKEKDKKEIKRVILGGGGSLEMDAEVFSKEIGVWTTKADKILADKLTKITFNLKVGNLPPVLFLNALGLSLLNKRKEELNFLKDPKVILMLLEKQQDKEKEAKEKEKEEGKEDQEVTKGVQKDETSERSKEEKTFRKIRFPLKFNYILIMIIVALVSFLGVFVFIKKTWIKKGGEEIPTPSPAVQTLTPTVTLAPAKKIDRHDLKIKVLNGSGISGRANDVASLLESLGYQVMGTNNAESFDYEETVVKIKEEKRDFFSLLTSDLITHYTVSSEKIILADEEEVDVVVIVGKEKK